MAAPPHTRLFLQPVTLFTQLVRPSKLLNLKPTGARGISKRLCHPQTTPLHQAGNYLGNVRPLLCCTHPGPVLVNGKRLKWALMLPARECLDVLASALAAAAVVVVVCVCLRVCVNADRQPAWVLICSHSDWSPKGRLYHLSVY